MDATHLTQAKRRFDKAKNAYGKICVATNLDEMEDAWADFISSVGTVYNKLQAGAGKSGQSYTWFSQKVKERKDNSVLKYVHQARNSEEHGVIQLNVGEQASVNFTRPGRFHLPLGRPMSIEAMVKSSDGLLAMTSQEVFALTKVKNAKYGDETAPPEFHGTAMQRLATPEKVAKQTMELIDKVLAEASLLPPTTLP